MIAGRNRSNGGLHFIKLARVTTLPTAQPGRLVSTMRPAELAHRSIAGRCLLIGATLVGIVACSSSTNSYNPIFTTTPPITTIAETTTTRPRPTTSTTSSTTTTSLVATTTTLPTITEGGVIKVANATDVEEAAQELTSELSGLGFAVEEPTNAAGKDEELTVSKIYVKAGSEPVAQSVSYLMGGIEILRMPTPAWIFGGTDALGNTNVLVMLGSDLAGTPLLVMRFAPGRQGPD